MKGAAGCCSQSSSSCCWSANMRYIACLLVICMCMLMATALPAPPSGTAAAALASLTRILGRDASTVFAVQLSNATGKCASASGGGNSLVTLTANSAIDTVFIAGQYLKAAFHANFAWQLNGDVQVSNLPPAGSFFPAVPGGSMRMCRSVPYTYYQNVVQSSYSNVWWNYDRWVAEVDWMALHGVNIALSYTGQEALWRDVFLDAGLNQSTLDSYFNGPAFLAWSRGQGLMGFGGPLPSWWYPQQLKLAQQVLNVYVDIGVVPVLPVFQGNVPPELHYVFPQANISTDGWLDVFDPLFNQIQDSYMKRLLDAFPNQQHFFEADGLFSHASGPWAAAAEAILSNSSSPLTEQERLQVQPDPDAQARARTAFSSFAKWDADAVWVYQTWIWRSFENTTQLSYLYGWLTGVPQGRFFLLDQTAERVPIWAKFGNFSFFGQPFAWLAMSNMGGNLGLIGSLHDVSQGTVDALTFGGGACQGIGIDPEGINTNPAYFQFVLESAWRSSVVDTNLWLQDYGVTRCGADLPSVRQAYALLHDTVYRSNQTQFEHHLAYCSVALPMATTTWNKNMVRPSYASQPLGQVWALMLQAAASCPNAGIQYDLIDVAREYLSLFPCVHAYDAIMQSQTQTDLANAAADMNQVLIDLDQLLGTHRGFMVGPWIADARALGASAGGSEQDLDLLELNARRQITTWLPINVTVGKYRLNDYANKQFSGLTVDYYSQRYSAFITLAEEAILSGLSPSDVDPMAFAASIDYVAGQWQVPGSNDYPVQPSGDLLQVASQMYQTYIH